MLLKLSGHISDSLERAAAAEQRAAEATDPAMRRDHEVMAQAYRHLALSYQFVESVERFLTDSRSLPRKRIKHVLTFKERLLKNAQEARAKAMEAPAGPERDRLLLQARQSETAVEIDQWISSPGSAAPEGFEPTQKPKA